MDADSIEKLNSRGPYEHGLWNEVSRDADPASVIRLSGRPPLYGRGSGHQRRSRYLVDEVSRILTEQYSSEELAQMTILDVGCYDGWVLFQVAQRLHFKKMIGVEPRRKNIDKGVAAREVYGVEDKGIVFVEGEVESLDSVLDEELFDIVLCLGVIHHVESTPKVVRLLAARARHTLIIDTMVIDEPKKNSKSIKGLLSLKDVSYLDAPQDWAIAAFKYESPYFDGSTSGSPIVNVPQAKLVTMSMEASGLIVSVVNSTGAVAFRKEFRELVGVQEATFVGIRPNELIGEGKDEAPQNWREKARLHEELFCFGEIPESVLGLWAANLHIEVPAKKYEGRKSRVTRSLRRLYRASLDPSKRSAVKCLQRSNLDPGMVMILGNLSRSPAEKVRLELGKGSLRQGHIEVSRGYFKQITEKSGCDWRSFYRSCYFLMIIALLEADKESSEKYEGLLRTANWDFPLTIEEGVMWASRADTGGE
jgi:hypothetical protein